MSDEAHDAEAEGRRLVARIMNEIALMQLAGDVEAVAVAIIGRDGNIRTRIGIGEGQKLPLLAATVCLQQDVLNTLNVIRHEETKT